MVLTTHLKQCVMHGEYFILLNTCRKNIEALSLLATREGLGSIVAENQLGALGAATRWSLQIV